MGWPQQLLAKSQEDHWSIPRLANPVKKGLGQALGLVFESRPERDPLAYAWSLRDGFRTRIGKFRKFHSFGSDAKNTTFCRLWWAKMKTTRCLELIWPFSSVVYSTFTSSQRSRWRSLSWRSSAHVCWCLRKSLFWVCQDSCAACCRRSRSKTVINSKRLKMCSRSVRRLLEAANSLVRSGKQC